MGATDAMKKAAITKLMNYLLADPEKNINKIMDTLEPLLPKSLFPSQRESIRNAIEQKNNWYQLIMKIMTDINPEVRDDLLKTFVIDANLLAWTQQEKSQQEVRMQHSVGHPARSDQCLQLALHRLLGGRLWQCAQSLL